MLQQKIIEKINNIFGKVDVYFDVEDITLTNKLAILINNFEAFPLNSSENVEFYSIRADFILPIISNNGWNIDKAMTCITEYNQKKKDEVNIIYPYVVSDDIYLTLEFIVDIKVKKNITKYPMTNVELDVTN